MPFAPSPKHAALPWREWRVLALLVLSGVLNYVDRSNLSIGATNIQHELHLSNYQLGLLLSAFFWTYAIFQLLFIAGWLVDRFSVCWILAAGVAVWSLATGVTGLVHGFVLMFGLRLVLGASESITYPSYSRILVNCFPEHHRGFCNAAIDAGTKTGPAIGALLGGVLIPWLGWRGFFIALGIASMAWLVPWVAWMPRTRGLAARDESQALPSIAAVLRQPALWATAVGLFCSNYFWYFLITWLPPYLEKERNFPKAKMAIFSSLSYFAIALSSVTAGWLSDRWITRGGSPTRVRKTFAGCGLALSTVLLAVSVVDDVRWAMALLLFACVSFGAYSANVFAISQTLAGPGASGRWTSLQNGFANLAGVAAPWFTGWVVDWSGHFFLAFAVATLAVVIAGVTFVFGIGKFEQVVFRET